MNFFIEICIDYNGDVIDSRIKSKNKENLDKLERDLLKAINNIDGWEPGYCNTNPVTSIKNFKLSL